MKILSNVVASVLLVGAVVSMPAHADRVYDGGTTLSLYSAGLGLVDGGGNARISLYEHNNLAYGAGSVGQPFGIRLVNRTARRAMAVVSVDGMGLLTGKTASRLDRGVILQPYESLVITQWGDGQPLLFGDGRGERYAARNGRWGDVGSVRVALFQERPMSNFSGQEPHGDPLHFVRAHPYPTEELRIDYAPQAYLVENGIWRDYIPLDHELGKL